MGVLRESPSQDEPGSKDESPSDHGAGGKWWGVQETGEDEEAGGRPPVPLLPILVIVAFHRGSALRSYQFTNYWRNSNLCLEP